MLDYYQMTMDEMLDDGARAPEVVPASQPGLTDYACSICGRFVGIYNHGVDHMDKGWQYKRDKCKYGHEIDWSQIDEAIQD